MNDTKKPKKIFLSFDQFQAFQHRVLGMPNAIIQFQRQFLQTPDLYMRVEPAIKKKFIDVQAIRCTIPEMQQQLNSCVERGESPKLLIKLIRREKTGKLEVEMVFYASAKERHIEKLSYYEKHPSEWLTIGEIVLTPKETEECVTFLQRIIDEIKG